MLEEMFEALRRGWWLFCAATENSLGASEMRFMPPQGPRIAAQTSGLTPASHFLASSPCASPWVRCVLLEPLELSHGGRFGPLSHHSNSFETPAFTSMLASSQNPPCPRYLV